MQPGTIILMNGPSAAGKSSLQKEVQKQFDEFYIKLGIDNLFDSPLPTPESVDPQVTKDGQLIRSVEIIKDEQGNQIIPLKVGPAGFKVIKGMHRAIAAYAQQGNNVVVDYILYDQTWLPDLLKALKGLKVYMVGIKLPLEVLEQREKARGTSPIGHARSHYATVHNIMQYDIELDTSKLSSEEAAFKLKEFIKNLDLGLHSNIRQDLYGGARIFILGLRGAAK